MITYKAVVLPAFDEPVGDETQVELVRMEIIFAIGSQANRAPEDIVRGTLVDLHLVRHTTIESIEKVE